MNGFYNTEKKGKSDFHYTSHEMKLNELEAKLDKLRRDSDAAIFFADEKKAKLENKMA